MSDAEREEWKTRTHEEHYGMRGTVDDDAPVWSPYAIRLGAVPGTWEEPGIDPLNRGSIGKWVGELFDLVHTTPDFTRIEYMPKGYGSAAPRTTCGSACPRHEHSCARSLAHGGECRDSREAGTEGCSWGPGLATEYRRGGNLDGAEVEGER